MNIPLNFMKELDKVIPMLEAFNELDAPMKLSFIGLGVEIAAKDLGKPVDEVYEMMQNTYHTIADMYGEL